MNKKSQCSVLSRAIQSVDGFSRVFDTLRTHTTLRGQSQSTFENYMHRIAHVSLHFNCLPEQISEEELNEVSCCFSPFC